MKPSYWKITIDGVIAFISVLKEYKDKDGIDFKVSFYPRYRKVQIDYLTGATIHKFDWPDSREAYDKLVEFYKTLE